MTDRTDTTPLVTRVALVGTLALTALALAVFRLRDALDDPTNVALMLWLFTVLFILRVVGQIVVALRGPRWLPPMAQWNLVPYRILLPIQIVFIVVMMWIDVSFTLDSGGVVEKRESFGLFLLAFSAVYATAMLIRYGVRMRRRPDQRWFGGTIPIVFHLVLASYLYVLGSFYAA